VLENKRSYDRRVRDFKVEHYATFSPPCGITGSSSLTPYGRVFKKAMTQLLT